MSEPKPCARCGTPTEYILCSSCMAEVGYRLPDYTYQAALTQAEATAKEGAR